MKIKYGRLKIARYGQLVVNLTFAPVYKYATLRDVSATAAHDYLFIILQQESEECHCTSLWVCGAWLGRMEINLHQ